MRWLAIVLLPLLAACGSASDKPATTPALNAQPITYMDIEVAKLTGPSCNTPRARAWARW